MRQKKRIMGRMCAAAALAITVTVGGATALAPAASADVAVASAATRSAAPLSPQGPKTRQHPPPGVNSCVLWITFRYPNMDSNAVSNACNAVPAAQLIAPHDLRAWAVAGAVCSGLLRKNGASTVNAAIACGLSAVPEVFYQEEWCATTGGTACLNAWNGGPWVNDYTGGFESGDNHQNFWLSAVDDANGNPTGNYQLIFDGSGSWAGQCIGDAYNNSGYADTSLDGCGNGTGGGSGWGTNFTIGTSGCPNGEEWFHNNHWNGYLAGSGANGSHFYLNVQTKYCFNVDFF